MSLPSSRSKLPNVTESASLGYEVWARLGYAAKGIVYLIIGGLAMLWAVGRQAESPDRQGALRAISEQPFGQVLLGLVAVGLFGYVLWCLAAAFLDAEKQGTQPKALATRAGHAIVAVSYGLLAFGTARLALGGSDSGGGSDASARDWTARLLDQPFGTAVVVALGLVVLGVALYQIYKAWTTKFEKGLNLAHLDASTRRLYRRIGQFGLAAQGVVMAIIGSFFIVAALTHDPGAAHGLPGALGEVVQQPYGGLLLGIVALGLVAFGVYSLVEARYLRINRLDPYQASSALTALPHR